MSERSEEFELAMSLALLKFSPFPELRAMPEKINALTEAELGHALLNANPSDEGALIGAALAGAADALEPQMMSAYRGMPSRCHDCAFRKGAVPNQSLTTVATAHRCVVEVDPFHCHHGMKDGKPTQLCRGWLALVHDVPGELGDKVRRAFWEACGVGPEPEIPR